VAARLLDDRLDLAGRDALYVHFRKRRDERLLGALGALEELGREPSSRSCGTRTSNWADPLDKRTRKIAGAMTEPGGGTLAVLRRELPVISASSIFCITARTISRNPPGLAANRSLTAAIAGLAWLSSENQVASPSPACDDRLLLSAILHNLPHATPALPKVG
jgi:hypothetical protein